MKQKKHESHKESNNVEGRNAEMDEEQSNSSQDQFSNEEDRREQDMFSNREHNADYKRDQMGEEREPMPAEGEFEPLEREHFIQRKRRHLRTPR